MLIRKEEEELKHANERMNERKWQQHSPSLLFENLITNDLSRSALNGNHFITVAISTSAVTDCWERLLLLLKYNGTDSSHNLFH